MRKLGLIICNLLAIINYSKQDENIDTNIVDNTSDRYY